MQPATPTWIIPSKPPLPRPCTATLTQPFQEGWEYLTLTTRRVHPAPRRAPRNGRIPAHSGPASSLTAVPVVFRLQQRSAKPLGLGVSARASVLATEWARGRMAAATRTVTVIFTDLVGSTAMSQRLDTAATDALRDEHFGLLTAEATPVGGTVVKNLGDGLMIVFDAPTVALSAAVGMQQAVERHNRGAQEPLAMRVGIATGEASESDGDFFGDPVVEAARLCALAEGGQILATDLCVRLVAGRPRKSSSWRSGPWS